MAETNIKKIVPVEEIRPFGKNEMSLKSINMVLDHFPTSIFETVTIEDGYVLAKTISDTAYMKLTFGKSNRAVSMDGINIHLKSLDKFKTFVKENIPVVFEKHSLNDENNNAIITIEHLKTSASYTTSNKPIVRKEIIYAEEKKAVVKVSRNSEDVENPNNANKKITYNQIDYVIEVVMINDAKPVTINDLKMIQSIVKSFAHNNIKVTIQNTTALIQYSTIVGSSFELKTSVKARNDNNVSFNIYFDEELLELFYMLSSMFNGNFTIIQDEQETTDGIVNMYYIIAKNENATVEIFTKHMGATTKQQIQKQPQTQTNDQNPTPKAQNNLDNLSKIL